MRKLVQTHACGTETYFRPGNPPSLLLNNPRQFWQVVNHTPRSPLNLEDKFKNKIKASQCASVLNDMFSAQFTIPSPLALLPTIYYNLPCMDPICVDFDGIVKIIKSIKVSSSCGIDNINSKILQHTVCSLSLFLTKNFQQYVLEYSGSS